MSQRRLLREMTLLVVLLGLAAGAAGLLGCAATGSLGGSGGPEAAIDLMVRMAGPVDEAAYYFVGFDTDADEGATFPVPVAAGPFWGNGWGTGSISYFLEYHLGQYNLFQTQLNTLLRGSTGGITNIIGNAVGSAAGVYNLTVQGVTLGAVGVAGTGPLTAATNLSDQNAGVLQLETNALGEVVAGSVSFTPAANGGRGLTGPEQAALNALNAGGVTLASNSLAALGLSLSLTGGPFGVQTLSIAAATATVQSRFTSASTGQVTTFTGTLTANSQVATGSPPVPGLSLVTGDLGVGNTAEITVELSPNSTLVTPDLFTYTLPQGGTTLRASFALNALGNNLTNLSLNFITVRELIFDPTVTDPDQHVYDGLGPLGNDALLRYDPRQFLTITNADSFVREGAGDSTLTGPATQAQKDAVDIVDWSVAVRRLQ